MDEKLFKKVASLSFECYEKLGKAGKPTDDEWSTLCSIVMEDKGNLSVACLATGTKCVTGQWAKLNNVIIDCHAECLCKRAFKRFLIYRFKNGKEVDDIKFHMFISQLPCGVIDRFKGSEDKKSDYLGVRRKPGKGERCSKPSCVDKLCKWNVLGLQGRRLLALTKKPIRCETIIIGNCGGKDEFNEVELKAALLVSLRTDENHSKKMKTSDLFVTNAFPRLYFYEEFKYPVFTRHERLRASNSAVVYWNEGGVNISEIVVNGFKQGVTKNRLETSLLRICKQLIALDINDLFGNVEYLNSDLILEYEKLWKKLKSLSRFEGWA